MKKKDSLETPVVAIGMLTIGLAVAILLVLLEGLFFPYEAVIRGEKVRVFRTLSDGTWKILEKEVLEDTTLFLLRRIPDGREIWYDPETKTPSFDTGWTLVSYLLVGDRYNLRVVKEIPPQS